MIEKRVRRLFGGVGVALAPVKDAGAMTSRSSVAYACGSESCQLCPRSGCPRGFVGSGWVTGCATGCRVMCTGRQGSADGCGLVVRRDAR